MKRFLFLLIPSFIFLLHSCSKDLATIHITYQEAKAIYGNMDEIRSLPLNSPIREIDNPGKIYVAKDFILIGEEEKGIHVIDNRNPLNPSNINFINVPGNREFIVKD